MLKIFINPGHDMDLDPGACANGIREVDICLLYTSPSPRD